MICSVTYAEKIIHTKVFNMTPSVLYKKSAIFDHADTDQHKTAIELELTNKSSVFQKQIDEQHAVADETSKAVFFALYWLMKEEIPNCKLSSLLKVVEKMGHPYITHFKYTAAGTERDMMMNVGEVVSGKTVEQVLKSQTYGILFDEVTDISVKQQMVCFIQYIDKKGHANVDFLDIANVLEFGTSSDAETLFKTLGLDIANCSSFVSDGASVMVGKENGVAAKMKQVIPTMVFILYLPSSGTSMHR